MDTNEQSNRNRSHHSYHNHHSHRQNAPHIDLYPVALRAIEEDDPDKLKTLIKLESFTKESIDHLLEKACERSHDISLEEEVVKNSANLTADIEMEKSMMDVCRTNRKNNEQLVNLLLEAESQAELVANQKPESSNRDSGIEKAVDTPTKPVLKSIEKDPKFMITPETPEFKSTSVRRQLKFS